MVETGNKISLNTKIISGSFSEHLCSAYELYIFISESEISCAVADKKNHIFIAVESWEIAEVITPAEFLHATLEESEILRNNNFRSVICCSGFRTCTIVPDPLFTPETAKDQLLLSSVVNGSDEILIDEIQLIQAKVIFAVPFEIYNIIASYFTNVEFHHTVTATTGYLISNRRNIVDHVVNVNIHSSFFEVIVTKGSQLIIYNNFNYQSAEEVVYYILFICEQLHLNPETVQLQFSGKLQADDALYILSGKYFRKVGFSPRPGNYSYDMSLNEIPEHAHFNLFSQVVCAS